ncbi:hypothetical protein ABEW34_01900 [Paenibacillus algorifonticola]|uniref:hypothetical protein n=1 Tax=Paenibacillus algorifonticola TaxID=684063 RepID=UPI003D26D2E1
MSSNASSRPSIASAADRSFHRDYEQQNEQEIEHQAAACTQSKVGPDPCYPLDG